MPDTPSYHNIYTWALSKHHQHLFNEMYWSATCSYPCCENQILVNEMIRYTYCAVTKTKTELNLKFCKKSKITFLNAMMRGRLVDVISARGNTVELYPGQTDKLIPVYTSNKLVCGGYNNNLTLSDETLWWGKMDFKYVELTTQTEV